MKPDVVNYDLIRSPGQGFIGELIAIKIFAFKGKEQTTFGDFAGIGTDTRALKKVLVKFFYFLHEFKDTKKALSIFRAFSYV